MSPALYELRAAGLSVEGRTILDGLDLVIEDRGVTVFMGAGGAGKTSMLRALAGVRGPPVVPHGEWLFDGVSLFEERQRPMLQGIAWCAQPPRDWTKKAGAWGPGLRRALDRAPSSRVVLLDEPNVWLPEEEFPQLYEAFGELGDVPVVLSTHHLEFARACADHVVLLGDQRVLAQGPAEEFFESSSPHVRRLLRGGSVWSEPPGPPSGFTWLIPGALAGMAQPGLMRSAEDDLTFLVASGVTTLVSLTEEPFDPALASACGLVHTMHFPIRDMGVPAMGKAAGFALRLANLIERGEVVALHCRGGLGRTGLMMALVLMAQGLPAEDAIKHVRQHNPLYIQTAGQLLFVRAMAHYFQVHQERATPQPTHAATSPTRSAEP